MSKDYQWKGKNKMIEFNNILKGMRPFKAIAELIGVALGALILFAAICFSAGFMFWLGGMLAVKALGADIF